jgi:hypothetical protein
MAQMSIFILFFEVFFSHIGCYQIRPPVCGDLYGIFMAPFGDILVMAREQNFWRL